MLKQMVLGLNTGSATHQLVGLSTGDIATVRLCFLCWKMGTMTVPTSLESCEMNKIVYVKPGLFWKVVPTVVIRLVLPGPLPWEPSDNVGIKHKKQIEFFLSRWLQIARCFHWIRFGDPADPRPGLFSSHRYHSVTGAPAKATCVKCLMVNSARGGGEIPNQLLTWLHFLQISEPAKYSSHPHPYGQNCLSLRAFWLEGKVTSTPVRQPPNLSLPLGAGIFIKKRIWHLLLPLNFLLFEKASKNRFWIV